MRTPLIVLLVVCAAIGGWLLFGRSGGTPVHTDRSVAEWVRQLDDPDVEQRYAAGLMLKAYGSEAVSGLAARLRRDVTLGAEDRGDPDTEGEPRRIAAETLAMIGEPALPALLDTLEVPAQYERALAQQAIATIGVTSAHMPRLLELVRHENAMTAGMAAHLIGTLPNGRDELATLVGEPSSDETLVHRLLVTLTKIDGDTPATLTPYLEHVRPVVRREALGVLQLVGARADQATVIAGMLTDEDESARTWAATLLRGLKKDALWPIVAAARDGTGEGVRLALGLIGTLGRDALSAVPVVKARMDDPSLGVRAAAAEALHLITGIETDSLPVLLEAARGDDRDARLMAMGALGGFTEETARIVPVLAQALESTDGETARIAAISLGNLGPKAKDAEDALQLAASSLDKELAKEAQRALALVRGEHGD